ncbi:MAG TPA: flagellar hook-associated protein FlgK, partial [Sporomusaceae bacterium]|nr:flagellar hook-associated protein FlgK [Sporomusaceae bacterium]
SKFLLTDFNSVHRAGYGLDASAPDNTNNNFFGADTGVIGTPANGNWIDGLKVSSALFATSPANGLNKIAAKGKATDGDGSGDWAVKMSEALKTTKFNTLNNSTLDGYYNSLVGAMGVQTQSAKSLTENQKVLVNQVNNWRLSISGVNMDEEMTNMIRFQKGYNAASRVMTTIDEMLDKLINGTGVVGR